jgi:hypothetical protein
MGGWQPLSAYLLALAGTGYSCGVMLQGSNLLIEISNNAISTMDCYLNVKIEYVTG